MTENNSDQTTEANVDIKALREAAERGKQAERELDALRRENAFRRAGIDPDDKKASYFVKGYEGDLDPQAIQSEAREVGLIAPPGPSAEQQAQLDGSQRIEQMAGQSAPVNAGGYEARLEEAFNEGGIPATMAALAQMGLPISED